MKHFLKRKKNIRNTRKNRQRIAFFLVAMTLGVFLVFIFRFSYISISGKADNVNLASRAHQKYTQNQVLHAKRGTIYDSVGNPIAEDSNTYTLYAVLDKSYVSKTNKPLHVVNKQKTARELTRYIPLSESQIMAYLSPEKKSAYQVEFGSAGQGLSLEIKQAIEALKLPGIFFTDQSSRLYPNGTFSSNLVGLAQSSANKDDLLNDLTGIMGIEKSFDNQLKGKNGYKNSEEDLYGYQLNNDSTKSKAATNGDNVYLTLDSRMQTYMEQTITQINTKYQPKEINAVLMNPKTGQVIAATQRPTFNPSTKAGITNAWRDSLVQDEYEPGSVMKILSLAAAIDTGHYNPNQYYNSGSINIDGTVIKDWNTSGWGSIPLSQAFPRSSNVGFVKIEQAMGAKTWQEYLQKFKVDKKTGIQLPGENDGSIQFSEPVDQAITSFGQGVNVNTMQMMQAFTAIANGGKMMKPQIVSKVEDPNTGKVTEVKPTAVGQPISADTSKQVLSAMEDVVYQDYGTGSVYKIPGYKIAVKTGTAQIASTSGGYLKGDNNYIFSVVGMAPASNPKYMLYITMKQPQNMSEPAEKILSEAFNPLMKRALISNKSSKNESTQQTVPNLTNESYETVKDELAKQNLDLVSIGTGNRVVQQLPAANEVILPNQKVLVLTNGAMTMPDVTGWSKSDILKLAQITGKKFKFTGSGYAIKQSIPAKAVMDTQKEISITLQQPN